MPVCACGWDEPTRGGVFLPGHDQRLRSIIEKKVNGLLNLEKLVDSAEKYANAQLNLDDFGRITKSLPQPALKVRFKLMDDTSCWLYRSSYHSASYDIRKQ